jgi:hypothetical protein
MLQQSRRRCLVIAACLAVAALHARMASAQAVDLLPNLEPFPASEIQLVSGPDGLELRFSTTSWNRGAGPMELVGGDVINPGTPENPGDQEVLQNIYRTDGSVRQRSVGVFEYHGGTHSHFHFENYGRYTLQPVNVQGTVGRGAKVSFCLLDNEKINTRLPNAAKRPVYQTCNPDIQGISVGWGDRYRSHLDGQSVAFGNNQSGDYLLIIEVNPQQQLEESNYSDNTACALVRVDVNAMTTNVIGTSCNTSSVTITEIVPNSMRAGSSGGVVIHGSGFASGMSVTFENGSGKTPIVNIQTITNDTITAEVTVPSGGSSADPVWDLRVGPTVKPNAFTVAR